LLKLPISAGYSIGQKLESDTAEDISDVRGRFDIVDDIKKWKFDITENISGCALAV
jgi:hypothetical protein